MPSNPKCFVCAVQISESRQNFVLTPEQTEYNSLALPHIICAMGLSVVTLPTNCYYCSECLDIAQSIGMLICEKAKLEQAVLLVDNSIQEKLDGVSIKQSQYSDLEVSITGRVYPAIKKLPKYSKNDLEEMLARLKTSKQNQPSSMSDSAGSTVRILKSVTIQKVILHTDLDTTEPPEMLTHSGSEWSLPAPEILFSVPEQNHVGASQSPGYDAYCETCGAIFDDYKKLKAHDISHSIQINSTFSNVSNPRAKLRCVQCKSSFTLKCELQKLKSRNLKSSKHQRMFKCEICDKEFKERHYLVQHGRTHSNLRPFPCDVCNRRFKRKQTLQNHVRVVHTGCKDYECSLCSETYKTQSILRKHNLKYHSAPRN